MSICNVELPCQIGDTVYFVGDDYTGNKQINEVKVAQIKISDIGIYIVDNEGTTYSAERLYFSEEEAKKEFDSKPLTIDELRQMNGKPVYCVDNMGRKSANEITSRMSEYTKMREGCQNCRWKERHQKCSCCKRNKSIKDNYEKESGVE